MEEYYKTEVQFMENEIQKQDIEFSSMLMAASIWVFGGIFLILIQYVFKKLKSML